MNKESAFLFLNKNSSLKVKQSKQLKKTFLKSLLCLTELKTEKELKEKWSGYSTKELLYLYDNI